MGDRMRILIVAISVFTLFGIVYSLAKRKMNERDSILWFLIAGACVVLGFFPKFLTYFASWVGVDYPPTLLFLAAILLLIAIVFKNTLDISELKNERRELISQLSILKSERSSVDSLEAAEEKEPSVR